MNFNVCFILLAVSTSSVLGLVNKLRHSWSGDSSDIFSLFSSSTSERKPNRSPQARGLDLKGELRKKFAYVAVTNPMSNLVCSPISALLPLGKLAMGANGQTFTELANAIGVKQQSEIPGHFKRILKEIRQLPGVTLDIASRLYLNIAKKLNSDFKTQTTKVFNSAVELVDFSNNYEAAKKINAWVSKQTHGKINDLLAPSDIAKGTSLIIVNAVYFSGKWKEPFEQSFSDNFYSPVATRKVPFMTNLGQYKYYNSSTLDAQILSIPYDKKKAAMVVVLPNKNNGIPTLIKQLNLAPELLQQAINRMEKRKVDVLMPKFRIESTLNLNPIFGKIGLTTMFSGQSGLKRIVNGESVVVSTSIQKAYIDVNEFGTKAAAATALLAVPASALFDEPDPIQFVADRPFFFHILAMEEELFSGLLVDPPVYTA